jgi:hypothetical protein
MFLELNMFKWENLPELGRATGNRERSGTREVDRVCRWLGRVDACFGCVYCEREVFGRVILTILLKWGVEVVVKLVEGTICIRQGKASAGTSEVSGRVKCRLHK